MFSHCKNSPLTSASHEEKNGRPSAEYKPSHWTHEYIQSLHVNHPDQVYMDRLKLLEETVRNQLLIRTDVDFTDIEQLQKLEMIDSIVKLGLGYRLDNEINLVLETLTLWTISTAGKGDADHLYETALRFRLVRQNGLQASQDAFKCFLDKNGRFDKTLSENVHAMLALYEAAHLASDEEGILEEARAFSTFHLSNHLSGNSLDERMRNKIMRTLELPSHWRVQILETQRHIVTNKLNTPLLELARLDYNLVQATLQSDLKDMSRWWKDMELPNKVSFARDRLMECFFWATAMVAKIELGNCRRGLTQIGVLITVIDDVYDVYGSLDDLELFTQAVQRWDLDCINDLPEYMKHCYLALYNTVNQIASDVLQEKGINVTQLLAKSWADLCAAFMVEARWFTAKHTPSFDQYMKNGCVSVSGPLVLVHAYCLSQPISTKILESLQNLKHWMVWPSMFFRLSNDLATYSAEMARGETANSVTCYMLETGSSEEEACAHVRDLVEKCWKKINFIMMAKDSVLTKSFKEIVVNLVRVAHCVYEQGDGHGAPNKRSKDQVMSLIVNPISLGNV